MGGIDETSAVGRGASSTVEHVVQYVSVAKDAGNWQQGEPYKIPYEDPEPDGPSTVIIVFIPILVVILTVLLGVLIFLIALLCMRRQKGIRLTEDGGPLDLSRGDGVMGEGGVEGVESRWLETTDSDVRDAYKRAKGGFYQTPSVLTLRLAAAISPFIGSYRYYFVTVSLHPREGSLRLGF